MSAEEMTLGQTSCLSRFFWGATMLLAVAILVSACGGGGGGGGGVGTGDTSAPPENDTMVETPPEEPPEPSFESQVTMIAGQYRGRSEFSNQWGLGRIGADRAYAHLELELGSDVSAGKGVTIGILDTDLDLNHPSFVTNPNDPDKDRKITKISLGSPGDDGTSPSHGTAVASIAAGGRNIGHPESTHGIAWNANLAFFAIRLGTPGPDFVYSPVNLAGVSQGGLNRWFGTPLSWRGSDGERVDILNLSFGLTGIIENYSETELRNRLGSVIRTMAQAGVSDKTIFVWSGGNEHGLDCVPGPAECKQDADGNWKVDATSLSILQGLPARISELRGHTVAVVAIDQNGTISDFSNRCGIAAEWCLAAPGRDVRVAYFGPNNDPDPSPVRGYGTGRGTSYAAPMVSGGLALMKQLFRGQLSNTALLSRLLATANKSGIYANRSIYGQGLMNLGAATAPVGETTLSLGDSVSGPGGNLQMSNIVLGSAFGDGLTQSLAGREIAAFDSLGAPFWFDLGGFATPRRTLSIEKRLENFMAPAPARPRVGEHRTAFAPSFAKASPDRWRLGLLETPTGTQTGHLGLAKYANTFTYAGWKDLAATAFSTEGYSWRAPTSGAVLSWQPPEAWAGLRAGWLMERKSLLGSSAKGAFGNLSTDSAFVGLHADTLVDGWHLGANAEVGFAIVKPRSGLIADVSPVATGAFAVHATRPFSDNRLFQFSVSQPLRAEKGRATLSVPIGRTKGGDVMRRSVAADIVPTGRQIDVMAHWRQPLTRLGELRLGAVWVHDPGHRASASSDLSFMAGWRTPF